MLIENIERGEMLISDSRTLTCVNHFSWKKKSVTVYSYLCLLDGYYRSNKECVITIDYYYTRNVSQDIFIYLSLFVSLNNNSILKMLQLFTFYFT